MARRRSAAAVHVGAQIAAARVVRGMTVDELAVAAHIDSSNIRSYEAGRAMLSVLTLIRVADALGAPPSAFIDGLTAEMFAEGDDSARADGGAP